VARTETQESAVRVAGANGKRPAIWQERYPSEVVVHALIPVESRATRPISSRIQQPSPSVLPVPWVSQSIWQIRSLRLLSTPQCGRRQTKPCRNYSKVSSNASKVFLRAVKKPPAVCGPRVVFRWLPIPAERMNGLSRFSINPSPCQQIVQIPGSTFLGPKTTD